MPLAPVNEVAGRDDVPIGAARDVRLPHHHKLVGPGVGQRLQQHRANDAEDRGGRADAKSQRHQREQEHTGSLAPETKGELEIAKHLRLIQDSEPRR